MLWGVQGELHTVCVAQGGLTACPVCGLLAGLGRWEPVDAAVCAEMPTCALLAAPPRAPGSLCRCGGAFCASAWAGAGALFCCSTALLPGEGSTALAKGSSSWVPARISAAPPPLGHCLGSLQCPCTHRIAQLYPTLSPCITFGVTQGSCPCPDAVTWDRAPYRCSWSQ